MRTDHEPQLFFLVENKMFRSINFYKQLYKVKPIILTLSIIKKNWNYYITRKKKISFIAKLDVTKIH